MALSARKLQRASVVQTVPTEYRFGFEAGTASTNVSTAVTAPDDTAWGGVGVGTGASLTYDATHVAHGSMAAKLVPSGSVPATMRWNTTPSFDGAFRYYIWWGANPTDNIYTVWLGSDTATRVTCIVLGPTGDVRAYNKLLGSAYATASSVLPLGGWTRIELAYHIDSASATSGRLRLGVYAGDSTTALADSGWVTTDLGIDGITFVRVGKYSSDANSITHWLDSVTYADGVTDLLGPVGGMTNQRPVAYAGVDQTVSTSVVVTLDGSGSADPDGTIASYAWTQTAGTTASLSSSSAQKPTFTAPSSQSTLTFSLTVTDTQGLSSVADTVTIQVSTLVASYDWSDSNLPWAYTSTAQFTAKWPTTGVNYIDYVPQGGDFYTELYNLVNFQANRVVVRLPTGVFHLNQFRMIGTSGDPLYAKAFWHPRLRGLLGQGPDNTIIQLDPNSVSQAQLNALSAMPVMTGPNQLSMLRIDGTTEAERILIGGLTFRGTDQNPLTTVDSSLDAWGVQTPQPAPYTGIDLYAGSYAYLSYVRFQGSAHAMTSAPPFEAGCVGSQYSYTEFDHCEMDGRLAPEINVARPTRCTIVMANNEYEHRMVDCWMHDTNVSRYAVNDENRDTYGVYELKRSKIEKITVNKNDGNGGYENAAACGWESCAASIYVTDSIISVDNPFVEPSAGSSQHFQFTNVGSRAPQGGRFYVTGSEFRNTGFPDLDGFVTIRCISNTYWYTDGLTTTMSIKSKSGATLQPYVLSGGYPPSASTLAGAGVTPNTHYIVRTT